MQLSDTEKEHKIKESLESNVKSDEKTVSVLLKPVNLTMTEETVQLEAKRPKIINTPKKKGRLSFSNLSVNDVKL